MAGFFGIDSAFARGVTRLTQMLYAGMLWFVYSIPVVTMGAATEALYEVMLSLEKDQEGYVGKSFFRAFVKNLRQVTPVWAVLLAAQVVFGVNLFYYAVLGNGNFPVQCVVFGFLFACALAEAAYVFPVMAKFENTRKGSLRMAAVLAVRNPGWTVLILAVQVLTVFVCWFFMWFPIIFLMGPAAYIQAGVMNHIFDRLIKNGTICVAGSEKQEGE